MTSVSMNEVLKGLVALQLSANKSSTDFGYWTKPRTPIEVLSLTQTELSRVIVLISESGGISKAPSKIEGFTEIEEQLADVIIRVMDFAAYYNLNVSAATVAKMKYNDKLSRINANASDRKL